MVPGLDPRDPRPDRLDDARPFVPEDDRQLRLQVAGHVVEVAVAHPGGEDPEGHLADGRLVQIHVLDGEWEPGPRRTAALIDAPIFQTPSIS